jgi:hypothetical protein
VKIGANGPDARITSFPVAAELLGDRNGPRIQMRT